MLQRLNIRGKILAVVAVPIIVLLLAVGVVTLNATQTLSSARNVEQLLGVLGDGGAFTADLQTERNFSVNYVDAVAGGASKRNSAVSTTDSALTGLETVVADQPTPEGEKALADATAALDGTLEDLRAVDITDNGLGEWPSFPSAEDAQATADAYVELAAKIDAIGDATPESANVTREIISLSFALGNEGVTTFTYLTEPAAIQEQLIKALPDSAGTQAAFENSSEDVDAREENDGVRATLVDAGEQLSQLPNVRTQVVNRSISVAVLNGYFSDTIKPMVKLSSDVASVVTDRALAAQLRGYNATDSLIEAVRSEEVFTDHLLRAGEFLPGDSTFQRSLVALSDIALDNAQSTADPLPNTDEVPPFGASALASDGGTSSFESIRTNISSGLDASLITERSNQWPLKVSQELDAQIPVRDAIWDDAEATSADALQSTIIQTILTIVGAVLVVFATIFIALVIARRIIGPLRRLTTTATAVRQELPRMVERVALPGEEVDVSEVQIPVESNDEIGRLAEAFNGVNAATLAIAGEQAALRGSISEMFVNVARRDQVLLNRQLSSIDEMERTEDNPDTLTRLFALDHLATRMRRNSESLLVLAGIDTGRRLRRPMPLSDVIRTASSEIELYERVQLELDADPAMVGHSALTAAHLFAELLENATVFSDPGSPVVVRTFERDGNVVVEVVDTGIGMTLDELREANNRVASTAASEILGAQRLGLFVVGRIARRVNARVSITSKEGAGTTATITMAPSLFDSRGADMSTHVSTSAVDATRHAPAALVGHSVADEILDNPIEPDATRRPSLAGYQPATVQEGASLSGRVDDAPAAPVAAPVAEPTMEDLIAADAAAAPAATVVDPAELSSGLTASGLPARRRRAGATEEASAEEQAKIIGLPVRATPDQLSALDAESPAGFRPAVSADEIAPQSAEERAAMFRGFRSRRSNEEDVASAVDPEAESLGQAARRGAFTDLPVADAAVDPAPVADAAPGMQIPVFEDDDASPASAQYQAAPVEEATPYEAPSYAAPVDAAPVDAAPVVQPVVPDGLPTFSMPKFEVPGFLADDQVDDVAVPQHQEEPAAWSVPQFADEAPATPEPVVDEAPAPMVVPGLEEDPEEPQGWGAAPTFAAAPAAPELVTPAPVVPVVEEPAYQAPSPYTQAPQHPGVEQVSLETGPTFGEQLEATQPPASAPYAPEPQAPAPQDQGQAFAPNPAHGLNPAELAALTATPSMDELMAGDDSDKPNFFSRLFGRGKKGEQAPATKPVVSAPASTPFSPRAEQAPVQQPAVLTPAPSATPTFAPEPTPVAVTPQPAFTGFAPEPAPATTDFSQAPAMAPRQVSLHEYQDDATGWSAKEPVERTPFVPEPTNQYQAPQVEKPVVPAAAASFFAPRQEPSAQPQQFSPDELANPVGWEAAGASALQAAQPDVQTSYSPKVDLESDHAGGTDLSSVFSEFSSLSSSRPKVEKTRTGLQKRRTADAPPVEVTPIEEEVALVPRERDADAVRSRFSSFYSGTQRARSDAAEFERSQATTELKE